ncbi:hypothetical protein P8605_47895, partial [Streptomyces sp. T-3]|nr:hypothetical protein [Streptomyces sp. T-3]
VDSIKRTEIAGELGRRLLGSGVDLRSLPDAELEELTRARTAAGIAQWLRARVPGGGAAAAVAAQAETVRGLEAAPESIPPRELPEVAAPAVVQPDEAGGFDPNPVERDELFEFAADLVEPDEHIGFDPDEPVEVAPDLDVAEPLLPEPAGEAVLTGASEQGPGSGLAGGDEQGADFALQPP